MAISTETIGRLYASGRNYISVAVGFIGGVGLVSASQSKGLTDSLGEIYNGVSMIVHGATSFWQIMIVAFPIIGGIMAKLASNSAKTTSQATAVKASIIDPNAMTTPEVKAIVVGTVANMPEVKSIELDKSVIGVGALAVATPDNVVVK